jgi:hypothetical protein
MLRGKRWSFTSVSDSEDGFRMGFFHVYMSVDGANAAVAAVAADL